MKTLALHASAFGLYLFAVSVRCFSNIAFSMYPLNDTVFTIQTATNVFFVYTIFIADLLLCAIFWDLGTNMGPKA